MKTYQSNRTCRSRLSILIQRPSTSFAVAVITLSLGLLLPARLLAADLVLLGTHPTSPLTAYPTIHTLRAFEGRIYLGYGEWAFADSFPPVVVASYDPAGNAFHLEFSANTDSIGLFREINGALYVPSIDPTLHADSADYSSRAGGIWRDGIPYGMLHAFDVATLDGSDLWLVGSKNPNETLSYGPAVFRSPDGGRTWQDLTIQSTLSEARYYWGFPLRGRFYVRDTHYEGTNGTRTASAPYVHFNRATLIRDGTNEFVVGVTGWVSGTGGPLARLLVTFDGQTWRIIRGGNTVYHFTVSGSNIFTLEYNAPVNALWMASAVTPSSAVWQRLNFNNVPANAKAIEVLNGVIYVADTQGRLWAGRLDGGAITPTPPTVVNELSDDFGRALSFDGDILAVGAPDHSDSAPLCGQVTVWQPGGTSGEWTRTATIAPPTPSLSGWFGKYLALKDDLLAVIEAGRDLSRRYRGSSAQVHLYERVGQNWAWRQSLNQPQAQSVAINAGWLAVGATNSLSLYSISRSSTSFDLTQRTNFVVPPSYFNDFQALARVTLEDDLCAFAVVGDLGVGGLGQVQIFQRDGADVWRLQQVLRTASTLPPDRAFAAGWMHDASGGVWHADGQAGLGFTLTTRLNGPAVTVRQTGAVQLSFSHRWNFEPDWDGGQVRVSINGSPYNPVPATAFTQNGYNGAVSANSSSGLRGQSAFINESSGHSAGTRLTSICTLGPMNAGDTISIQFLYGAGASTRGAVPNWEIDSVTLTGADGSTLQSDDFNSNDGGYTVETDPGFPPDRFGFSLALHNGWLAVGAPRDDTAALQAGAVHLFERTNGPSGASFVFHESIFSPLSQPEAAFGNSVALKDSTLLVGCPGAELGGQRHHGAVFVFRRETNTWRNVAEVFRPSGSAGEFGTTVAFRSNWLAAGSRYSNASTNLSDRVAIWRFGPPGGELSAAQLPGMGDFQVSASGELGHTYYFQAATNLAAPNWTDLFPFTLAMPSTNLTDTTTAIGPQRFYRLRSETNAPVP